jgi:hypothetical protein
MDQGTARLRAARWVIGLGRLYGGLLALVAAWSLLGAVSVGSPVALLVPLLLAGLAAAWATLLRAFRAHRRGAWQVLVALAVAGAVAPVVVDGSVTVPGAVSVLGHGCLLALLLHPDSRDWVAADPPPGQAVGRTGGPSSGGHWGTGQPHQVPRTG